VTEAEWNACTAPQAMLAFVQEAGLLSERKARLFAVACCRRIWHLLTDERSRRAVEVAEAFADGVASEGDVAGAARGAWDVGLESDPNTNDDMRSLACLHAGVTDARRAARETAFYASRAGLGLGEQDDPGGHELQGQAALLRDIVSNPFGPPPTLNPSLLTWHGGTVVKLAEAIYQEGRWADMPLLADALEEAGCTDQDVLGHCRGPGPHAKGCWLVDALLGRGYGEEGR
jgi:hypothetical protein